MSHSLQASLRAIFLFGAVFFALYAGIGAARAQSCNEDLAALGKERNTHIEALNAISKSHGNKLDPIAACPHLRKMKEIEGKMVAYLAKNKDWCNIPDDFLANFKGNAEKTAKIAEQACALAAKAKQMQQNGGVGNLPPPPKLPGGPL
ncbi:MAG TPA: hypothetical protein VMU18_03550 [Rhodoblastus sp.]|nr:hypothetical protein [Rhodoblastus sp.]